MRLLAAKESVRKRARGRAEADEGGRGREKKLSVGEQSAKKTAGSAEKFH